MSHGAYIFSVFIHIVAACLWLGGMLFLILAFIPGIKNHNDKVDLIASVSLKFRIAGSVALIILFITGILQLEYRSVEWNLDYFTNSFFGKMAGLKLLVFSLILLTSLIHDYRIGTRAIEAWKTDPENPKSISLRNSSRMLGRINFLLALIAVFLGVILARGW